MPQVRIGTSGWTFAGWRGGFYPKGLPQKDELKYASRRLNSIEINGTFYSLQKPESFQRWRSETPDEFVFSVKAPQYMTHVQRLKEPHDSLANFLASGLLCLGKKLGPILWQFPPNVTLKDDRFERFFELLPRDSASAARLARKHTSKVEGRSFVDPTEEFRVRHAFEFRHPSFANPAFVDLMRKHGVAFVFAHSGLKSPYIEDVTADFVYARMHGQGPEFKRGYPDEALSWWETRVRAWTEGRQPEAPACLSSVFAKPGPRDAFVYFDTEAKEYAPDDAQRFAERMGLAGAAPEPMAAARRGPSAERGLAQEKKRAARRPAAKRAKTARKRAT